jgi:hypothetical protein
MYAVVIAVWIVVIGRWAWNRRHTIGADSVGSFRRELSVLERSGPVRVAPANRRRPTPMPASLGTTRTGGLPLGSSERLRRQRNQRRRRDVLLLLVLGVVLTLGLAAATRSTMVIYLQAALDLTLAGYVYLLARSASLRQERQVKVAPISRARNRRPALATYQDYAELSLRRAN